MFGGICVKEMRVTVRLNEEIAPGIYEMDLQLPEDIEFRCGQFVNLSVGDGAHLLRRPFAIAFYNRESRVIGVCYQVKGEGTKSLASKKEEDALTCVLPLGKAFKISDDQKKVALIGGGVGVFPLISVLNEYRESDKYFCSYMGFRSKEYVNTFGLFDKRSNEVFSATDDGSFGVKGNAVQLFFENYETAKPDIILACGPTPMLRALKEGLKERGVSVPCYVSLEERMGCGIGACLVCVCKKSGKEENARVCKDGPVFEINEVEF